MENIKEVYCFYIEYNNKKCVQVGLAGYEKD